MPGGNGASGSSQKHRGRCSRSRSYVRCRHDAAIGFWRVAVDEGGGGATAAATEFVSRWLVVATGENAEPAWPEGVEGMDGYRGVAMHTSSYKKGDEFRGKNVLVVGCGNSGMEVSLDLCNNGAKASMVVRDKVISAQST